MNLEPGGQAARSGRMGFRARPGAGARSPTAKSVASALRAATVAVADLGFLRSSCLERAQPRVVPAARDSDAPAPLAHLARASSAAGDASRRDARSSGGLGATAPRRAGLLELRAQDASSLRTMVRGKLLRHQHQFGVQRRGGDGAWAFGNSAARLAAILGRSGRLRLSWPARMHAFGRPSPQRLHALRVQRLTARAAGPGGLARSAGVERSARGAFSCLRTAAGLHPTRASHLTCHRTSTAGAASLPSAGTGDPLGEPGPVDTQTLPPSQTTMITGLEGCEP